MTGTLSRRWERFWFAPQSPVDLAVCRILFFGMCFYFYAGQNFAGLGSFPRSFYRPVWLFERLHLPVFSDAVLEPLTVLWKVALVAACVGLLTRPATLVAAVLTGYFAGLPFNFGKTDHNVAAVMFVMGILSVSRCGDALSLDRMLWRLRREGAGPAAAPPAPSGEYRWPIRLVWVTMSLIFFAAGMAKLRASGLSWVFSDNFAILLTQRHYSETPPMVDWGLHVAAVPWLTYLMAAGSIAAELLFPLALVDRRLRVLFPLAMFGLQLGIGVLMNVWFGPFLYTYLFWVPWLAIACRLGLAHQGCDSTTERPRASADVPLVPDATPAA